MNTRHLEEALQEYREYIDKQTRNNMPDYYKLKDLISFTLEIGDNYYAIDFRAPEYWKYAENGRGPGKYPPYNAIASWIQYRQIVPTGNITVPQLNYLIRRKIALKGTEGSHFLENSIAEEYFDRLIIDAITEDISDQLDDWMGTTKFMIKWA